MGRRHNARRLAMQMLYQMELRAPNVDHAVEMALLGADSEAETKEQAKHLALGTWKDLAKIDEAIAQRSKNWSLDRMSRLDIAILRMSMYEMGLNETPTQVVIDEAIELAKEYSSVDSPKFINGILGVNLTRIAPLL